MNRFISSNALILALAFLVACNGGRNGKPIHASGHVEATEVRLAAKVGGRLIELPFQEGDAVKAGQVVARFDTIDARNDLARAQADRDGADARLRLLLAGSRVEDVRQAREELERAQADLDSANRDASRLEGLAERGTATVKARDDARTRREMALRAVEARRAALDKLVAGARREEVEAARAQRAAAEAALATVMQRIADATVVAPRNGTITARAAEPGEVLAPGALLSVLTDIAQPWLTVYVDEPSLGDIKLGQKVRVRVDGRAADYVGVVSFISPAAEFTPKNVQTPEERAKLVFKVKVQLDNTDRTFKPGMPADAYFSDGKGAA